MEYNIIRSRRKTISIQISPQGQVIVRCPLKIRQQEIRQFVESKMRWIENHLPKEPLQPSFTEPELLELCRRAKSVIPERVRYYALLMGVDYGRITIRSQKTRWGSCSAKGNLNFNCLLMLIPPEILDYVVVHELCHRKELNHSAAFWAEVEQVLPDYRERRKWLKDNGNALIGRLPE